MMGVRELDCLPSWCMRVTHHEGYWRPVLHMTEQIVDAFEGRNELGDVLRDAW
jgi:hypothetical protein